MVLASITDTAAITSAWTGTIFALIFYVIVVIALWRVFSKAGYPGVLAIIPIVNMFVLVKVGGMSAWWGLLYFVPIANFVLSIVVAIKVGRNFGHGGAFSFFLLWLFSVVGYFIIGYGSSKYVKV
ncbi:hypothetical protein GCM10009808_17470 [Microbacterium sediminicola]|uniref:Signal peptidase I n=1 Tax=Microbacterium sediminicola TaxID=415210 RepID=A0ABP4U7G1_9MICO